MKKNIVLRNLYIVLLPCMLVCHANHTSVRLPMTDPQYYNHAEYYSLSGMPLNTLQKGINPYIIIKKGGNMSLNKNK